MTEHFFRPCVKLRRTTARRIVSRIRDSRGATLVEAAIITPLLLLLTFSIVDFASLFYVYLALENGVSQATRYAVTGAIEAGMTREQSIKAAMRNATPTLTLGDGVFSFSHLPPGATTWSSGTGAENDIGKVTINYQWTLMTPLIRPFFTGGQVTVRVESAMKNERKFE
jgi:Flp pilus assembly protein TadG